MKTPNNWDFPQKFYSSSVLSAEYSENMDIRYNFSKILGNLPFCMHNTDKSNKSIRGNSN